MNLNYIDDVRKEFADLLIDENFVTDKSGSKVVEIINASFIANEPYIFGKPNEDYIERELQWYCSMSRNVHDIPGKTPPIWLQVADSEGRINSNYGWCIYSEENGLQFENVVKTLIIDSDSRRAEMIYTRPSMHTDYRLGGMSDFMCTEAVQYFIRNGELHAIVKMRSNDAVFGYNNDYAWQRYVQNEVLNRLTKAGINVQLGNLHWNAGSLHVYERHFKFIEEYLK